MNESKFWEIVEQVDSRSGGNMDKKCELLKDSLMQMPREEAHSFAQHFNSMLGKSYSRRLWASVKRYLGYCSDDKFIDFRSSLISRGYAAFKCAVEDPRSLAETPVSFSDLFYEGYQYAAWVVDCPNLQQYHATLHD